MALDRLMQHIREHEFADILGLVSEMRSHRLSMVQTEVTLVQGQGSGVETHQVVTEKLSNPFQDFSVS